MMSTLVNVIIDYASDTVVSLTSGCVSLIAVTGLCYGVSFLVYKHIKHLQNNSTSESENKNSNHSIDNSKICNGELQSTIKLVSLTDEQRSSWFLTKNESDKSKTFRSLREYLKVIVASSNLETKIQRDGKIREFLEHLVESLISENLDDVPLTPLSNDVQYETIFSNFHPKLSSTLVALSTSLHSNKDSESLDEAVRPSTLYNELKSVVVDIREQAASLPLFQDYDNELGPESIEIRLEGQSYEEILSTAILNKIISRSQISREVFSTRNDFSTDVIENVDFKLYDDRWSSSPKDFSLTVEERAEEIVTEYQLSEEEAESLIQSSAKINLIERHRAHFPELGKDVVDVGYNSYDEDNVTEIISNIDSWEENWLFQRKKKSKIKNTISQVSVPMLVPNPSEKYRALIGDVDVDETSDLSECSDSIIEDLTESNPTETVSATKTNYIYKYDFKNSLEIPTLKNDFDKEIENFTLDQDQDSSGVTSISRDVSDMYSFSSLSPSRSDDESLSWNGIKEAKNENIFFVQEDSGEGSLETQPETEYLSNDDLNHASDDQTTCEAYNFNTSAKLLSSNYDSSLEQDLATPPKPGTIAEREHLKWEQATPIPNNPYSKESIEKRNLANFLPKSCISPTSSGINEDVEDKCTFTSTDSNISKYERDYYINGINKTTKHKENNHQEAKINHVNDEKPSENGFVKILPSDNSIAAKPKSNLVRVSSWSERKRPEIEVKKRLPSVKELAKQFSGKTNITEVKKTPVSKNQTVHSLTARSMSKEFREGLKNNIGKTFNRNILSKYVDETDRVGEISPSEKNENGLDLSHGVVIWENKI